MDQRQSSYYNQETGTFIPLTELTTSDVKAEDERDREDKPERKVCPIF